MKNIGVLGSTGSVGTQTLDIVRMHPDKFNVVFLSAHSNFDKLYKQALEFNPDLIHIYDKNQIDKKESNKIKILTGREGLLELCSYTKADIILNSIVGFNGLEPTLKILESGINLALANKESIVQAGHLVMDIAKSKKLNIFPVDSEHSAIWQCLIGEAKDNIKKIILTASGGPFRELSIDDFPNITKEQALKHPNWEMGNKISIDSATMMNKGFEFIEAYWLFGIPIENIEIVVHPQSIIHSMVEFKDGSIKAQLSSPNMRLPIQFALSFPERYTLKDLNFNVSEFSNLTFKKVDLEKFRCVKLAIEAIRLGGSYPAVLNVSNDLCVDFFLNDLITFNQIPDLIEKSLDKHEYINNPDLSEIKRITHSVKNNLKEFIRK